MFYDYFIKCFLYIQLYFNWSVLIFIIDLYTNKEFHRKTSYIHLGQFEIFEI